MFLYNNPESYWDFAFSFSEYGLKRDATISPSGKVFSFLTTGEDSTAGTLEFYTQSGGKPIYLYRDLSIKKESAREVVQHYEFFDDNLVAVLLRDDSTGVQRVTFRRYDENKQKWLVMGRSK